MRSKARRLKKVSPLIIYGVIIVAIVLAALTLWVASKKGPAMTDQDKTSTSDPIYSTPLGIEKARLNSSEALASYIATTKEKDRASIRIGDQPQNIDWSRDDVIAVTYGLPAAYKLQSVGVEKRDSKDTIVISVLGAPKGCLSIQVTYVYVSFVLVQKGNEDYPVIRKTTPNSLECK